MFRRFLFLISLFLISSCVKDNDENLYKELLPKEGEHLSSMHLGTNSSSSNSFGFEISGLTLQERGKFAVGNSLFNQSWVSSPASTTARDGLGPIFNARACANCHFKDGRGEPLLGNDSSLGLLFRLSNGNNPITGKPLPLENYGDQLQVYSLPGVAPEGKFSINYEIISGKYPDGVKYELRKPTYTFNTFNFAITSSFQFSPRVGQQTIGMGLIDALPVDQILQFEDEFDSDNDGISGKANYILNEGNKYVGKFGWKANIHDLKTQVAAAFHGDLGLTTSNFLSSPCESIHQDCLDAATGGEPEVTDSQLEKVVFYQSILAVPNRRNYKDQEVLKGKNIFNQINCIKCHQTNQVTSSSYTISQLENIIIRPYSDFLLHDMGNELADNRSDFSASGSEWRTQPLWGLGLINTVNNHTFLLHDGRARNIEEAILWHGGEALTSKNDFMLLSKEDRDKLILFLKSL